jgi:hypothetical protein
VLVLVFCGVLVLYPMVYLVVLSVVVGNSIVHLGYGWCEPANWRRCQNGANGQRISAE